MITNSSTSPYPDCTEKVNNKKYSSPFSSLTVFASFIHLQPPVHSWRQEVMKSSHFLSQYFKEDIIVTECQG